MSKMRMVNFTCSKCKKELEELIKYDDEGNPDEIPTCPKCSEPMKECAEVKDKLHKEGLHYRHVTWGTMDL